MGLLMLRWELRVLLEILGDQRKPYFLPAWKVQAKESDDILTFMKLCVNL